MPEVASVYALLDALDDDDTLPNPDTNSEEVLNQSNSEPVAIQEVEIAQNVEEMAREVATQGDNVIAQAPTLGFADINATQPPLPTEPMLPQPNWPSPVIYPQRPPKKLKSLAAIDLPKFPRHQ